MPACTKYSSQISIKDNLIENKEKLNDLNDQILSNQQKHIPSFSSTRSTSTYDMNNDKDYYQPPFNSMKTSNKTSDRSSSDADIRFTRKKLGESAKTGYILIAAFLGTIFTFQCENLSSLMWEIFHYKIKLQLFYFYRVSSFTPDVSVEPD